MFARKVSVHLKADAASAFIQRMEDEIIPVLRKQKGFLDDVTLISQKEKNLRLQLLENCDDAERTTARASRKSPSFSLG